MHACAWLVVIFPHPPSLWSEAARAKMGHAGTTLRQGHEDHSEHWLRGGFSSLAWDFPTRGSTRGGWAVTHALKQATQEGDVRTRTSQRHMDTIKSPNMNKTRELQRERRQSPGSTSDLRPEAPHMLRRERCLGFGGDYAEDCRRTRGTRDSLLVPKREPAVQPPNDRYEREITSE